MIENIKNIVLTTSFLCTLAETTGTFKFQYILPESELSFMCSWKVVVKSVFIVRHTCIVSNVLQINVLIYAWQYPCTVLVLLLVSDQSLMCSVCRCLNVPDQALSAVVHPNYISNSLDLGPHTSINQYITRGGVVAKPVCGVSTPGRAPSQQTHVRCLHIPQPTCAAVCRHDCSAITSSSTII